MSLGYMLIYLLNDNVMPFNFDKMFPTNEMRTPFVELVKCRVYKEYFSLSHMAEQTSNATPKFIEFIISVENMKFDQKPDYKYL